MEFCTTATVRPEIIDQTYKSFFDNLIGLQGPHTLYINIDPVPTKDIASVLEVCNKYFQTVISNAPSIPSFPAAVKWCLSQPKGTEFFYLEDDWILNKPININDMRALFSDSISVINLRAYPIKDNRICLSPSLWKRETGHVISSRLDILHNPEKQLRPISGSNPGGNKHLGYSSIQYPLDTKDNAITDIGRPWLKNTTMAKNLGVKFTAWTNVEEHQPSKVQPKTQIANTIKITRPAPACNSIRSRSMPVVQRRIVPLPLKLKPRI
jgi:hypothetical protein